MPTTYAVCFVRSDAFAGEEKCKNVKKRKLLRNENRRGAEHPDENSVGFYGRGKVPAPEHKLLCGFFFFDYDLQMRSDFLVQLDGNGELAERLQRFVKLDLAAVKGESFLGQRVGDVA
jgi:hypothetical protein